MRMTLVANCVALALASAALAQQSTKLPVTGTAPPRTFASINHGLARGYVFWPVNAAQYNHAAPCQGLTVRATRRGNEGQTLPTDTNLTSFGAVDGYTVCAYAIQGLPEGADLRIYATAGPSTFTPRLVFGPVPADSQDQNWYVKIPGGACSQLVPAAPTASVLVAASWTCGDYANNVNFDPLPYAGASAVAAEPALARPLPPAGAASSGSTGTLLASGSQQTLLGSGRAQPAPGSGANLNQTTTTPNGAPSGSPTLVPSKGNGRNEYDAVTLQRGVTQDPGFANWANSTSGTPAVQRQAITDGTLNGGTRSAGTPQAGQSQTTSAQGNVGSPLGQQGGTVAVARNSAVAETEVSPIAAQENPALWARSACATDPTSRLLAVVNGTTGQIAYKKESNLTLRSPAEPTWADVFGSGREFTLLGCSFGSMPVGPGGLPVLAPSPGSAPSMSSGKLNPAQQQIPRPGNWVATGSGNCAAMVYFLVQSWTNNSIVISVPSNPDLSCAGGYQWQLVIHLANGNAFGTYLF